MSLSLEELLEQERAKADSLDDQVEDLTATVEVLTSKLNSNLFSRNELLMKLSSDLLRDECPTVDPSHASWDRYFKLVNLLEIQ